MVFQYLFGLDRLINFTRLSNEYFITLNSCCKCIINCCHLLIHSTVNETFFAHSLCFGFLLKNLRVNAKECIRMSAIIHLTLTIRYCTVLGTSWVWIECYSLNYFQNTKKSSIKDNKQLIVDSIFICNVCIMFIWVA